MIIMTFLLSVPDRKFKKLIVKLNSFKNKEHRDVHVAQRVEVLVSKAGNLVFSPRTHTVEKEN